MGDLAFRNTQIYGFDVDELLIVNPHGERTWIGESLRQPLRQAVEEQGESGSFDLEGLVVTYRGARPIADA